MRVAGLALRILVRIIAHVQRSRAKVREVRGKPTDVARQLLREGKLDEVAALVDALAARNSQLELLVAALKARRNKAEGVSKEQLSLALEELAAIVAAGGDVDSALAAASTALEKAASENGGRAEVPKAPPQPALRRPPPANLRRVKNPIPVPAAERACPGCGAERKTVTFETTEVVDLIPAEVIVRLDVREVCACPKCDAEMVRAPQGDKVVVGGAYGSQLVAWLLIGKYADGLPLHRQHEVLKRLGFDMPSTSRLCIGSYSSKILILHSAAARRVTCSAPPAPARWPAPTRQENVPAPPGHAGSIQRISAPAPPALPCLPLQTAQALGHASLRRP